MQQDFLLQQKITRMIVLSIPRIQNMRKPEKYTLGKHMEDAMMGMLEAAIDGNLEKGSKRPHQQRLDREKAKLSGFLDICVDAAGNLTIGTVGASKYVAEIDIPKATYTPGETEEDPPTLDPIDMSTVVLTLWAID